MTNPDFQQAPPDNSKGHPRLIVVGFSLPDQSSHFLNELLGYKTAAEALGFVPGIFVPRTTDPDLAALLSAKAVLGAKPVLAGFDDTDVASTLDSFLDASENLGELWTSIEAEDLSSADAILFPEEDPALIRGAGLWLAGRPPDRRPSIFFRFVGNLLDSRTGRPTPHTAFYRLAARDLRTRAGHERVHFLVTHAVMHRTVTRVCDRRAYLMPMPKHLLDTPEISEPARPTIYVHLNERSAALFGELGSIVRHVLAFDPTVRFLVKYTLSCAEHAVPFDPDTASAIEVVAAEQDVAGYLTNFSRCTLVLLAYEPDAYTGITSGVFSEAVSFGKPLVVPAGTTMALEIEAGRGTGTLYATPRAAPVAAALVEALKSAAALTAAARDIAARLRSENTCLRFVERMIEAARNAEDTEPRYRLGEPIDFASYLDSRCFMREGWGKTEDQGVWTVGPRAELELRLDEVPSDQPLVLSVVAEPFLTPAHRRNRVRVSAAGQDIANWDFEFDDVRGAEPAHREAVIPPRPDRNGALTIVFTIEAPVSPRALGLSDDERLLGLHLQELRVTAAR